MKSIDSASMIMADKIENPVIRAIAAAGLGSEALSPKIEKYMTAPVIPPETDAVMVASEIFFNCISKV